MKEFLDNLRAIFASYGLTERKNQPEDSDTRKKKTFEITLVPHPREPKSEDK